MGMPCPVALAVSALRTVFSVFLPYLLQMEPNGTCPEAMETAVKRQRANVATWFFECQVISVVIRSRTAAGAYTIFLRRPLAIGGRGTYASVTKICILTYALKPSTDYCHSRSQR
jgi:hypothetical protein